ncbi:MAG TPA: NAD(P)H-hydrate dehydratase [Methylomusa anaerophila]|uniref:Bifunctional NAD(P)H-hydrate repair enzyme n=1 Tax=Methylomusa anaerophila TaxID=1930071 RepID=A0A348AMJ3_9FIRM|nr:NAD(P)H-hydrate dehydratase [Methylomusa anaerophila]BBB92291.1 bifunctional NAD(P)H-hydrate repair enzyme Nnr [Methylomusa anaerophila]HML90248.1 NAD(P)H-hydrate dehydratase [Methylomusa anaerophila]
MKVATAAQMREADSAAIHEYGISGVVLMENAGVEVVRRIEAVLEAVSDKKVCILAGTGNNGGDGYVIARHLANRDAKVKVYLFGERSAISGDAKTNLDIIFKMRLEILEIKENAGTREWNKLKIALNLTDCIVDSLLGTGFHGEITGNLAQAIDIINQSGKPVIAVDIPSGVNADTGQISGTAVKATHTVTFALPKPGLFMYPGAEYAGELTIADIGIPAAILSDNTIRQNIITLNLARALFPKRNPTAHKGVSGRVGVIAGSVGLSGAAAMASMGALRAGAGLVTLGIPAGLNAIMEIKLTEVMTAPLPETEKGGLSHESLSAIVEMTKDSNVLAVGPGLGREDETAATVRGIISTAQCPLVIDADGINALEGYTSILSDCIALPVMTPHPGELTRLTGLSILDINRDRMQVARRFAAEWGCILILKGAATVVAFPDGEIFINTTGNAGMATGGTGDVLTGIIAGLIAQGISSHDAAILGVFVHGFAGDMAAQSGMIGLVAGDLLNALPAAIQSIQYGVDW